MGRQIAHAVGNCGIVGRVGQAKQRLRLFDEKIRVQQRLPSDMRLKLRYYIAMKG